VLSDDFPGLAGFRAGSVLAGYRLEAQVGVGGMAVVFRARDQRLNRLVALKILAPTFAADAAFRRRFMAESRAAAAVDDPHVIPVYEADEADGVLFIAMRFVTGGDLRRVLERDGALLAGRAAQFISPVASALDAAHRAGLMHRDVKPANILVDASPGRPDHVYLSDFGVSKGALSLVSVAGHFVGTPGYSAPEQIQGWAVDGRTDQYALACVAYQLLSGTLPFERDQPMAVMLAHLSEPPPSLTERRPGLPAAADQVLAKALAKVPEKRYGSCRDFADALREALGLPPYTSAGTDAAGYPGAQTSEFPGRADAAAGDVADAADGPAVGEGSFPATAGALSVPVGAVSESGGPDDVAGGLALEPDAPTASSNRASSGDGAGHHVQTEPGDDWSQEVSVAAINAAEASATEPAAPSSNARNPTENVRPDGEAVVGPDDAAVGSGVVTVLPAGAAAPAAQSGSGPRTGDRQDVRRRRLVMAAAAVLVIAAGLGTWLGTGGGSGRGTGPQGHTLAAGQQQATDAPTPSASTGPSPSPADSSRPASSPATHGTTRAATHATAGTTTQPGAGSSAPVTAATHASSAPSTHSSASKPAVTHAGATFSISVSGAKEYSCKVTPPSLAGDNTQSFSFIDKTPGDVQFWDITPYYYANNAAGSGGVLSPGEVYTAYIVVGSDWTIEGPGGGCLANLEITGGGRVIIS
jgi:hypothetical protein